MRIRTEQPNQSSVRPGRLAAGFTLLEMVIVLGIIALLLGGAVAVVGPRIFDSAKITKVDGDFQGFKSAFMTYRNLSGYYPTGQQGFKALVEKPGSPPVPRRWQKLLDQVPLDPWGNEYRYRYPGSKEPNEPEFISLGPDKQENTDDDITSQG